MKLLLALLAAMGLAGCTTDPPMTLDAPYAVVPPGVAYPAAGLPYEAYAYPNAYPYALPSPYAFSSAYVPSFPPVQVISAPPPRPHGPRPGWTPHDRGHDGKPGHHHGHDPKAGGSTAQGGRHGGSRQPAQTASNP